MLCISVQFGHGSVEHFISAPRSHLGCVGQELRDPLQDNLFTWGASWFWSQLEAQPGQWARSLVSFHMGLPRCGFCHSMAALL